jgi:hypothetical protein
MQESIPNDKKKEGKGKNEIRGKKTLSRYAT